MTRTMNENAVSRMMKLAGLDERHIAAQLNESKGVKKPAVKPLNEGTRPIFEEFEDENLDVPEDDEMDMGDEFGDENLDVPEDDGMDMGDEFGDEFGDEVEDEAGFDIDKETADEVSFEIMNGVMDTLKDTLGVDGEVEDFADEEAEGEEDEMEGEGLEAELEDEESLEGEEGEMEDEGEEDFEDAGDMITESEKVVLRESILRAFAPMKTQLKKKSK